jgi:hypothetical protein
VTLTHTSSLCKELWFEYKVGMKVLIFLERLLVLIVLNVIVCSSWLTNVEAHHLRIDSCFGVDCVRFMVGGC